MFSNMFGPNKQGPDNSNNPAASSRSSRDSTDSEDGENAFKDRPSVGNNASDNSMRSSSTSSNDNSSIRESSSVKDSGIKVPIGMNMRPIMGKMQKPNFVAIAAMHNALTTTMSGIKNNLDAISIKEYYGIKIEDPVSLDVKAFLESSYDTEAKLPNDPSIKLSVMGSKSGKLEESTNIQDNAKIFQIIRESIKSKTETVNWNAAKGKNEHRLRVAGGSDRGSSLGGLNLEFDTLLKKIGQNPFKLAAVASPCTQLVFGYEVDDTNSIVASGQIQSFMAGAGSSAKVGSFNMKKNEEGKYIVTVGGEGSLMFMDIFSTIMNLNKNDIQVQASATEEYPMSLKPGDDNVAGDGNNDETDAFANRPSVSESQESRKTDGGKRKTKRRKNKTVRFNLKKHKKTLKKRTKSHRKRYKKGKK